MALDGIVLSHIVKELNTTLLNGRIDKIHQTEKEDLFITVRNNSQSYKLFLTANSSYPRLHLTTLAKNSPSTPPLFCMVLRKHLGGGKVLKITQPNFERIVEIEIEATNELGDKEIKKLFIEIMGRHSNIILTKEDDTILDSIKRISSDKSSLREVLPGRTYIYPPNQTKYNPLLAKAADFNERIASCELPLFKALYQTYNGLSPTVAKEICILADLDPFETACSLKENSLTLLYESFHALFQKVIQGHFESVLYTDEQESPLDFYSFKLQILKEHPYKVFDSVSELLGYYYYERGIRFTISQKTADIRKLLHTFIERAVRKKALQEKAIEDSVASIDNKIFGELLTAYAHQIPLGSECFTTTNYYSETFEEITIPLEPRLTAIENAQKYFKQYNKAKRTTVAAKNQLLTIEEDLAYLNTVLHSLELLETPQDIEGLRAELIDMGYLKKKGKQKGQKPPKNAIPYMLFTSSKGHAIYVGKNNYQNDSLTMKFAKSTDLWLHIKDGPGSHVIIRLNPNEELDDTVLMEGAMLAAYYSSGKQSSNVPIDYTYKKYVKKVPGAKPGMVIYTDFKTVYVTPYEASVRKLSTT